MLTDTCRDCRNREADGECGAHFSKPMPREPFTVEELRRVGVVDPLPQTLRPSSPCRAKDWVTKRCSEAMCGRIYGPGEGIAGLLGGHSCQRCADLPAKRRQAA